MTTRSLLRAVEIVGSQTKLANECGVTQPYVWNWINRDGRVPAEFVIKVAKATRYEIKPHDLRPDIYPRPDDCVPERLSGEAA